MRWTWSRYQRVGAIALLPGSLCFIALRCALSPEVPFLSRGEPWIMAPTRVSAELRQWGSESVPATRFTRSVHLEGEPRAAPAEIRGLQVWELAVNGERVPTGGAGAPGAAPELPSTTASLAQAARERDWREVTRVDLAPFLTSGENEIVLTVRNARGPALLAARFEGLSLPGAPPLKTDGTWRAALEGGAAGPALAASDTRANPSSLTGVAPGRAFSRQRDTALLLFTSGVLIFWGVGVLVRHRSAWRARFPALVFCAGVLFWLYLFPRFLEIPLAVGFDARHHSSYVDFLIENRTVPLATQGWSMFHPPLFYALTALVSPEQGAAGNALEPRLAFRAIPFLSGLATLWLAFALARRLLPDSVRAQSFAVAFAALLPVNIYSSAYFSNESLHTLLSGAGLLATVRLLLAKRVKAPQVAWLGTLLGLALLVKFTAVVLVPIALFFLVCKECALERSAWTRILGTALAGALPILLIAGWYYVRNWMEFGEPFMANWGGMPGAGNTWWQQPGFRTLDYYLSFGASLRHPFLAGFESIWDSVYSTWWGDGFVAGRVHPSDRHPYWNYDFMAMAYWVSLPATALILLGGGVAVQRAFRDLDAHRRVAYSFLTTTTWAVVFGFLYLSLSVPFYSQAKASYGLLLAAPLALFFALGAERCDDTLAACPGRYGVALRAAFYGWFALWLGVLLLSFAG